MFLEYSGHVFAICAVVLYIKFLVTSLLQAHRSFKAGTRCPEDTRIGCGVAGPSKQDPLLTIADTNEQETRAALELEARWKRIVQNDVESIPMASVVFVAALIMDASPVVVSICIILYTISRVAFTIAYAYELQPHRLICWGTSIGAVLLIAIATLIAAMSG